MNSPDTPDPLERLRRANPASADHLRAEIDDEQRAAARERAVERGAERAAAVADGPGTEARRPRLGRSAKLGLGAALGVAAAAVAAFALGAISLGPGSQPAYAEAAIRIAEANPRILIREPGWGVAEADEFELEQGLMSFTEGGLPWDGQTSRPALVIEWAPAERYYELGYDELEPGTERTTLEGLDEDSSGGAILLGPDGERKRIPGPPEIEITREEIEVLGTTGMMTTSTSGGQSNWTVILPPEGNSYVSIMAEGLDEARFRRLLDSLYRTDVETWLAALPPAVVQPVDRATVVDEMLDGVPIPPGLDIDELYAEAGVGIISRYQLAYRVFDAVACEWIDRHSIAFVNGDRETAREAVEALSTVDDWPILDGLDPGDGYSSIVSNYAEEAARGVEPTYDDELGCDVEVVETLMPGG